LASKLLSSFTIRDLWHSSIHLLITSFPGNFIVKPNVLGRFYLVNTIIQLLNVWDLQFTFLIYCKLLKLLVYTTLTKHLIGIKNLIWWCLLTILIYQCLSLVRWSSCSKVLYLLSIRASHTLHLWYIYIISTLVLALNKRISCLHWDLLIYPFLLNILLRVLKMTMLQLFKFAPSWHVAKLLSTIMINNCIRLSRSLTDSSIRWWHRADTPMPVLICLRFPLWVLHSTHLHGELRWYLLMHLWHYCFAHY